MPADKKKSKSQEPPKATSERITLKGEKRARVVYVGPKGGKYVRMDGKYVSLKSVVSAKKSGQKTVARKMNQKGGTNPPESICNYIDEEECNNNANCIWTYGVCYPREAWNTTY